VENLRRAEGELLASTAGPPHSRPEDKVAGVSSDGSLQKHRDS
jgi:hypothetical protein